MHMSDTEITVKAERLENDFRACGVLSRENKSKYLATLDKLLEFYVDIPIENKPCKIGYAYSRRETIYKHFEYQHELARALLCSRTDDFVIIPEYLHMYELDACKSLSNLTNTSLLTYVLKYAPYKELRYEAGKRLGLGAEEVCKILGQHVMRWDTRECVHRCTYCEYREK